MGIAPALIEHWLELPVEDVSLCSWIRYQFSFYLQGSNATVGGLLMLQEGPEAFVLCSLVRS